MRLEPVYLLAPEPEPPKVSRRKAILAALSIGTFAFAMGGALGAYLSGGPVQGGRDAATEEDERLIWAERLQRGSEGDLLRDWGSFMWVFETKVEWQSRLWPGIQRLIESVETSEGMDAAQRRALARALVQCLQRPGAPDELRSHLALLRSLSR